MNAAVKISALLLFVGLVSFSSVASAQDAPPPPPPPPPGAGPDAAPPPAADPAPPAASPHAAPPHAAPPHTAPAPYHAGRCGVPQSPRCYHPAPRYYRPRHRRFWRLGLYLGAGAGGFGILGASGPYKEISPGGFGNVWIGLNFSRRFALELGFIGSVHNERFSEYDNGFYGENDLMLWGVTLDAKFNLVAPGWRSRFVPYLQAGVGAYGLVGDYYDNMGYSTSRSLATGAGVQLGGGIDIYLARWLVLGARVLYRGIVLGELKCGNSGDRCASSEDDNRTTLHGLTGELNMSIVF